MKSVEELYEEFLKLGKELGEDEFQDYYDSLLIGERKLLSQHILNNAYGRETVADRVWMATLFSNHPSCSIRQQGSPIVGFYIDRNQRNPRNFSFYFRRADGTSENFSYGKCCTGHTTSRELQVEQAMRNEVASQLLAYRDSFDDPHCEHCDGYSATYHVHHKIHFRYIKGAFLNDVGISPLDIKLDNSSEDGPMLVGSLLKKMWRDYHKQKAVFMLLCEDCHKAIHREDK